MNYPPPPIIPDRQRTTDIDHLNLISIFHFVMAGLSLLGVLVLVLQGSMMHTMMDNPKLWQPQGHGQAPMPFDPREFFSIFKWIYVVLGIWSACTIVVNVLSGIYIRSRRYRTFSLVVGAVNCLHIPLGTVLGIFTIMILLRPSVRQIYETGDA